MPILNPQQANNLIFYAGEKIDELLPFLTSLLQIASDHYSKNNKTIKIYNQFLDFIGENAVKIADFFNIGSQIKELVNIEKENAYSILYNAIKRKEDKSAKHKKSYEKITMIFAGLLDLLITNNNVNIPDDESYFYIPYHDKSFSWYISDNSYAVLTFNFQSNSKKKDENIFKIRLSAFLIAACGFTLVACVSNDDNSYFLFPNLFKSYFFSETHIFAEIKKNNTDFDSKYITSPNIGYVYLYVHFEAPSDEFRKKIEKCENNNLKIFAFSKNILNESNHKSISIFYDNKSIIKDKISFIPEPQDLSAFSEKEIPINLCNIPLYNQIDRNKDWIPHKISGIAYGYMNPADFLFCQQRRIEVKINNKTYYVEFPDIHHMNPELYVAEPMYLAKQNFDVSIVEKIKTTFKDHTSVYQKVKVKNSNINANIESKMHSAFHYLYKYTYDDNGKHIEPYTSQIYAAYQAISYLGKVDSKNKGIILQVHTGEGKSFIVQALAEHLARQGSVVHIATSNIILAARDFEKSYNYYTKCEKKAQSLISKPQRPSILLHSHELQYINEFLSKYTLENMPEKDLFYGPSAFKNSTNLNICVCKNNDKKKIQSNIIYSTFLNFEAFFLSQNEKDPNNIPKYINNCYLIIDEADTILIDELTNGTILSKPMKSNAIEILTYVYENYKSIDDAQKIYNWIEKNYPECEDLTINDVYRMFSDIDKVKSKDFTMGKKYTIDKDPLNPGYDRIVPFDSEHKGIAEPNKEFSGFIHQFIGIKEKSAHPEKFEKLIIQPLSLNYLFISHPTYVQKYKGICGVTGTIGNKREQELLQKYYQLVCQKVPRHQMNLRKDLPMILCNTLQERNQRICYEIETLHNLKYPVLVVFDDINDLSFVKNMLMKDYNIDKNIVFEFDGTNSEKNESSKKDLEKNAGRPGAITLGTNFCGRGVSINYSDKPLHVIVSYYKKDKRSISQALGRAGRNGHPGTTRIICTKEMYWSGYTSPNEIAMTNIINEFEIKNIMQLQFMDDMRSYFSWIFEETEVKEKIDKDRAYELRNCNINVNRITAFNFKFPICMNVKSFLKIQLQRIFSIKNCPECKYSWYLFRIYMRELILESWSLFLDEIDIKFKELKKEEGLDKETDPEIIRDCYNDFFDSKYEDFLILLHEFIPDRKEISIIDTFFYMHKIVIDQWQSKILSLNNFYSSNCKSKIIGKARSYTSLKVGTFPISLNENTGSKITPDPADYKICALINDPELKYIKKGTIDQPFSISIILDKIFESFQEIIDKKLENLFGIRFFLRRTLAGCEFGVCIDLKPEKSDSFLNCLVDTDPMFILTLCTKSSYFWMSGILLIVLVFFASIATLIATRYLNPKNIGSDVKKFLKFLWKKFSGSDKEDENKNANNSALVQMANKVLDAITDCIYQKISKNFDDVNKRVSLDEEASLNFENNRIFRDILQFIVPNSTDMIDEHFSERIYSAFKFSEKTKQILDNISPIGKLIKIGILLILLITQLIMNFRHKRAIKFNDSAKNIANTYQKETSKGVYLNIEQCDSYDNSKKFFEKDLKDQYFSDE